MTAPSPRVTFDPGTDETVLLGFVDAGAPR